MDVSNGSAVSAASLLGVKLEIAARMIASPSSVVIIFKPFSWRR